MKHRYLLKLVFGFAFGAAVAASANAAPLPPVSTAPALVLPRAEAAVPAVVTQNDVDRLKPEQVRWGHHWHGHWHHRHWGWHRWHHRHWRWHRWHHRHWGWHHRHWHRHW